METSLSQHRPLPVLFVDVSFLVIATLFLFSVIEVRWSFPPDLALYFQLSFLALAIVVAPWKFVVLDWLVDSYIHGLDGTACPNQHLQTLHFQAEQTVLEDNPFSHRRRGCIVVFVLER